MWFVGWMLGGESAEDEGEGFVCFVGLLGGEEEEGSCFMLASGLSS